jgi:outer membrane protein assembly factor BamB
VKRALLILGALVILVVAAGGAFALWRLHESRDIHGSTHVEFRPTELPARATAKIPWPTFGFSPQRTRAVAGLGLRPPFRRVWTRHAGSLVEFPPAIGYGRLFFATNRGLLLAVNAKTGRQAWAFKSHRCIASSPAIAKRVVFQTFMNRPPCNARGGQGLDGAVAAFAIGFGSPKWRTTIGPSESSPLVANKLVYVGDWRGKVYALAARNGKIVWTYSTGGPVKGAVALGAGRIYVGSYDGHLYCLDARTGKLIWRASSQPRLGHHGEFYSTPAVAYGRVYIGSTDGKVYSFGAHSGKLRWSHGTGNYVYGSPAIWRGVVLVGSYSGRFYAFDAGTGDVKWSFRTNGPISGSAAVIDGVVYFATLNRRTYALDPRTGRELWSFPDGKYTPVVAEKHRLFLVGYGKVYGMVPR